VAGEQRVKGLRLAHKVSDLLADAIGGLVRHTKLALKPCYIMTLIATAAPKTPDRGAMLCTARALLALLRPVRSTLQCLRSPKGDP
jgi:hypothetical protein